MNNSPNRISSELTSEKIKIINDIDLNTLFNLNYNFDVLKGIIEHLLTNQQKLQNQIDEIYVKDCDRDKSILTLLKDTKLLKDSYVDKNSFKVVLNDIKEIKEHLKKHDDEISESKYIYIVNIYNGIFEIFL